MNWVGGVRRRVLHREEVRRRQDIFFAAHAASTAPAPSTAAEQKASFRSQQPVGLPSGSATHRRISPQKWRNEEVVYATLKRGHAWDSHSFLQKNRSWGPNSGGSHSTDSMHEKKGHNKTCRPIVRPASIHGPFSRYLLRLELQSVGMKLEEGEKPISGEEQIRIQGRAKIHGKESGWEMRKDKEKETPDNKSGQKIKERKSKHRQLRDETGKNNSLNKYSGSEYIRRNCNTQTNSEIESLINHCNAGSYNSYSEEPRRKELKTIRCTQENAYSSNETPNSVVCNKEKSSREQASKYYTENNRRKVRTKGKIEKSLKNANNRECLQNTFHRDHAPDTRSHTCSREHKNGSQTKQKKNDKNDSEQKIYKRTVESQRANEQGEHGKKRHRSFSTIYTPDMLAGAPRVRQVLSLSPHHHKGKIWAPLDLSSNSFTGTTKSKSTVKDYCNEQDLSINVHQENTNRGYGEADRNQKQENLQNHDFKHRCKQTYRDKKSEPQSEWEQGRLRLLLGSQYKSSVNRDCMPSTPHKNINDQENKNTKKNNLAQEIDGMPNLCQFTQRSSDNLLTKDVLYRHRVSLGDRKATATKSHRALSPGNEQLQERTINMIGDKDCECEGVTKHITVNQKPKLSTFTRKIYKIENELSFARERKDKTPYLDRSFGTPWLMDAMINTPESSLTSSKTPTDPTFERSCEDPFGSQGGTDSHTNISAHTTISHHTIISTHNQQQIEQKIKNEGEPVVEHREEIGGTRIHQQFYSAQCGPPAHQSPSLPLYDLENFQTKGKSVPASGNFSGSVLNDQQCVTQPDETNNYVGLVFPGSNYPQWLTTETPTTLPSQQSFKVQKEGSGSEVTSLDTKVQNDLFQGSQKEVLSDMKDNLITPCTTSHSNQLVLDDECNSQTLILSQYDDNNDQSHMFTTENVAAFSTGSNTSDYFSGLHSANTTNTHTFSIHSMQKSHYTSQDCNRKQQDAVHNYKSEENRPWGSYINQLFSHKDKSHELSQCTLRVSESSGAQLPSSYFPDLTQRFEGEECKWLHVHERAGDLHHPRNLACGQLREQVTATDKGEDVTGHLQSEDVKHRDDVSAASSSSASRYYTQFQTPKAQHSRRQLLHTPALKGALIEYQPINLELAAKQFNKVMGLIEDDSESSWSDTTGTSQPGPQPNT